jgi:diphthamide synthase (EF-2-diphthine--ammonia ligase)
MEDVAVAWSTGKDAALALRAVAADPDLRVAELFTTVGATSGRVRGHGLDGRLLDRQVVALDFPHRTVPVPDSEGAYERHLGAVLDAYDRRGIDRVVYADLYVASIREYRESLLADRGIAGHWPLWGRDTAALADDFRDRGFEATVVRADADALPEAAVCRDYDRAFLADLPEAVDPCGENGAFHTFVRDGPLFDSPVAVESRGRHTETVERGAHSGRFYYCDLAPSDPD